jgi:hypothetical protein
MRWLRLNSKIGPQVSDYLQRPTQYWREYGNPDGARPVMAVGH